jgi:FlaA1/EpsC-like NDP-sugar epimerase
MFIDRTIEPVLALPRTLKRSLVLILDVGLCIFTVWFAFYLRLGEFVRLEGEGWPAAIASPLIAVPIFVRSGLYRAIFRHVSWEALAATFNACVIYGVIYACIFTAFGVSGVPRTVGLLQPLLLLMVIGASRVFGRFWLGGRYRELLRRAAKKKILVYGAGSGGRQLASAIGDSADMEVVGFLDDDSKLQGSVLGGKQVYGPARMEALVEDLDVSEILLALPSAARSRRSEILTRIRALGVAVRTLPGLIDVARGSVTISDLRPLEIDDLLGREAVVPDASLLERNLRDKTVMVTGAGGSIGSELCRQILRVGPSALVLVESSEFALYQSLHELEKIRTSAGLVSIRIVPLLASVTDISRMRRIFSFWRPDTVYHAAAYKHVPLVEHNVVEGVRNNVLGTWICASIAKEERVKNFVLISTDKAVRPTNVMGASKRFAELGLQALAQGSGHTIFSMVRFGNVLGSSGSVVPLFRKQIADGGPVTVTHQEITRYFMTIPEAAQLVIQAGAMARGGEVFVLDMGEPIKVVDLARRMIALSGLTTRSEDVPDGDIEIIFTGLRPGEKLYEELLIGNNPEATAHPRVMMANESFLPLEEYRAGSARMQAALDSQDPMLVRQLLVELVGDYRPANDFVDNLHRVDKEPASTVDAYGLLGQAGAKQRTATPADDAIV